MHVYTEVQSSWGLRRRFVHDQASTLHIISAKLQTLWFVNDICNSIFGFRRLHQAKGVKGKEDSWSIHATLRGLGEGRFT